MCQSVFIRKGSAKEMALELEQLGCDYEQGFYFLKPVPEADFLNFLQEHSEQDCIGRCQQQ